MNLDGPWTITLPLAPVAKGRPKLSTRGGFARAYTPAKTRHFEADLAALAAAHLPAAPLEGPVRLDVLFVLPRPAALCRKRDYPGLIAAPKRPDRDNLTKALMDGLARAWRDDAQVVAGETLKCYAELAGKPRIVLRLTRLPALWRPEVEALALGLLPEVET